MKKILIPLLVYISCTEMAAQTPSQDYTNHARYWYYRTRLRNDFMKVGTDQGCSIPMQERGYNYAPNISTNFVFNSDPLSTDGLTAKWGDSMSDLGYYIATLATEYKLLFDNGQDTKQVLYELYCALYALNRLDYKGEELWSHIEMTMAPTLDGFMVRDDVWGNFIYQNYDHFNYDGNKGFCSKVKINNMYTLGDWQSTYMSAWQSGDYGGTYLSQDNYYNVLMGLAFVRRFVPDVIVNHPVTNVPLTFQGSEASYGLSTEAYRIADRVFNYFKQTSTWRLQYPNGSNVDESDGGVALPWSFGHSEIMCRIRENNLWGNQNPTAPYIAFYNWCDEINWLYSGNPFQQWFNQNFVWPQKMITYASVSHKTCNMGTNLEDLFKTSVNSPLSAIVIDAKPDVAVMITNILAMGNCYYTFHGNTTGAAMSYPRNKWQLYHGYLAKVVLHGFDETCSMSYSNAFPWGDLNEASMLLSAAPCETATTSGPYNYGTYGPTPTYEWSATSRLDHPQRRGETSPFFRGEYNGVDYMLYHNLYYLARRMKISNPENALVDFSIRDITVPYPNSLPNGSSWGSQTGTPALVSAYEYITSTSQLAFNADVTMRAGKIIEFKPGFSVEAGGDLNSYIERMDCSDIFNPVTASWQNKSYVNPDVLGYNCSQATDYVSAPLNDFVVHQDNIDMIKPVTEAKTVRNKSSMKKQKMRDSDFMDNIAVYPNPTDGLVNLYINYPDNVSSLTLISSIGDVVYSAKSNIVSNLTVDMSRYDKGIYILNVLAKDGNVYSKKVVLQ